MTIATAFVKLQTDNGYGVSRLPVPEDCSIGKGISRDSGDHQEI